MALTNTQIRSLASHYAWRVVDSMDTRTLMQYAAGMIADSLDLAPAEALIDGIVDHEGGDLVATAEFMIGAGIPADEVNELLEGQSA